ncbi:SHOCT domain-containing protein [Halobellus limi]|uniref:Short C-terminal domain-containing protein n=1 Tax=Halobellus limi TaxID=699433 RepID=A0A1H5WRG4_9EURY|nr:SHOCT domain-containing protein [Halobellus limi]QCC48807.1 hypothetical protein DV707_00965 [Halobellus limi]SEG01935.1 Short C-terminal domain-containing protein [Halobellus limi]
MDGSRHDRSDRWWDEDLADSDDPVVGAVALLVLGAGLGSLFGVPILEAVDFWVVFVIGYAVVVPLVSLLRGRKAGPDSARRENRSSPRSETADLERSDSDDVDEALERLRDRYARGDLSEEQFERKLEVLLETDTPENARERAVRRRTDGEADRRAGGGAERDDGERERSR